MNSLGVASIMMAQLLLSTVAARAEVVTLEAKNFPGVDPTGAADSTQAIQAALNAAAGGALLLPKGVYSVTSIALPKAGIKISAEGAALRLLPSAKEGAPIVQIPAAANNIEIEGLEIDGGTRSNNAFRRISAIKSSGDVAHVVLKKLYIHDVPLSAIELTDGDSDWTVTDSRIDHAGRHGIAVDFVRRQVHDLKFVNNTISNCGFGPILIVSSDTDAATKTETASAGAADVLIAHNHVSHNGLDIAGYSPNNRNITVVENTIEDNGILNKMGHAIHVGGSNVVVRKNVARNTAISAIVVSTSPNGNPTPMEGFEISDNVIEGVLSGKNSKGILVENASVGKITGNQISGTRECPIEVDGNALGHGGPRVHDIVISGNTIKDKREMGDAGICVSNGDKVTVK